jgi:hypothetical protein
LKHSIAAILSVFLILSTTAGQTGEQTYVIKKGDTLWDLAFKFLGDPFKWSQLWHQNQYITNPNLIYPDKTLVVGGAGQDAQTGTAQENGTPASSSSPAPSRQDEFFSETKQALAQSEKQTSSPFVEAGGPKKVEADVYDSLFRAAMHRNNHFTSDFMEKTAFLWDKKDEKGLVYPGNASLQKMMNSKELLTRYERETYQHYEEVLVDPLSKTHYRPGDTVDIFHSYGIMKYRGIPVNLVRRVARGCIQSVVDKKISAVLFKIWDVVESGDRVDTVTHFANLELDTLVDPNASIKGTIFLRVENTELPYLYQTFILDKGSKDGVMVGDVFAVHAKNDPVFDRPSAIACAVRVDETSSTLALEKLVNSIGAGDTVSLVKRIRFK